jgi:hypothetical protein
MISRNGRSVAGFGLGAGSSKPMTYDEAIAANPQEVHAGEKSGPDLTDEQLSAPMKAVSQSLASCGAPDDMKFTIKVAIKLGKPIGVTVATDPPNASFAACVSRAVRGLRWPSNPKLDSFTTTY